MQADKRCLSPNIFPLPEFTSTSRTVKEGSAFDSVPCPDAQEEQHTAGSQPDNHAAPDSAIWEKVLWKRQACADNYTDTSFLQHLVGSNKRLRSSCCPCCFAAVQLCQVV
jgi:hypothetical protein